MKIFTKENVSEINEKYNMGHPISRYDNLWFQNNHGLRKSGIKYFLNNEELIEYAKCYNGVEYFIEKYCKIFIPGIGMSDVVLRGYQKEAIKHYKDNRFSIFLKSRQMGIQTILGLMFLHEILFNEDKHILISSYKTLECKEIFKIIKNAYMALPFFLKVGVFNWNEKYISLENKSHISCVGGAKEIAFGCSYDIISLNDFSRFHNAEHIYNSVVPIISNKKDSKIVINSGPNGLNFFHELVRDSERPDLDPKKNMFSTMRIHWWQFPGRLDTKLIFTDDKRYPIEHVLKYLEDQGLEFYERKTKDETVFFIKYDHKNPKTDISSIRQIKIFDFYLTDIANITNWREETIKILGSEILFLREYDMMFICNELEYKNIKRTEIIDKILGE